MNIKAGELYQSVVDDSIVIFIESVKDNILSPYNSQSIFYTILGNSKATNIIIGDYAFKKVFKRCNR